VHSVGDGTLDVNSSQLPQWIHFTPADYAKSYTIHLVSSIGSARTSQSFKSSLKPECRGIATRVRVWDNTMTIYQPPPRNARQVQFLLRGGLINWMKERLSRSPEFPGA